MTLLVPGIEKNQSGDPRKNMLGAGKEFPHIGRQRNASQELGPQAAVCRGEKHALLDLERGRRLSRLALESRWHGFVHSEGVVVVAIGAVSLQPGGQAGADGPAPCGPSPG